MLKRHVIILIMLLCRVCLNNSLFFDKRNDEHGYIKTWNTETRLRDILYRQIGELITQQKRAVCLSGNCTDASKTMAEHEVRTRRVYGICTPNSCGHSTASSSNRNRQ